MLNSRQYLSDADLRAMGRDLKALPPMSARQAQST